MPFCIFVISFALAFVQSSAKAEPGEFSQEFPARYVNEFNLGFNFKSFEYIESQTPPLRSEERAQVFMPSISGLWGRGKLQWGARLEGLFNFNSQFTGTTFSGADVRGTNQHSIWEAEALLNYQLLENYKALFGFGYHYWDRFLNGEKGYREIYTWYFLKLGLEVSCYKINSFEFLARVSLRQMLMGKINIIFSETYSGGDDTELDLGNKMGYQFEFPIRWQWPSQNQKLPSGSDQEPTRRGIEATPWYAYSEIGESNIKYNSTQLSSGVLGSIREPASRTQELGIRLAFFTRY